MDKKKILKALIQLRAGYTHICNDFKEDGSSPATVTLEGMLAMIELLEKDVKEA